ncbi:hypothetical protein CS542_03350 [Pedobacter sp. IW39]|nr:hypothetical protein CS542_03350 [Pedobacter sp. IW39]
MENMKAKKLFLKTSATRPSVHRLLKGHYQKGIFNTYSETMALAGLDSYKDITGWNMVVC